MTSSDDFRALYYFSPDINSPRLQDPTDFDSHEPIVDEKKAVRFSIQSMDSSELSAIDEEDDELLQTPEDLEAQKATSPTSQPAEYTVSTSKKLTYLGLYFLLNLGVTLSNKALLRSVGRSHSTSLVIMLIPTVGIFPLAAHLLPHLLHLHWLYHPPCYRTAQTLQALAA